MSTTPASTYVPLSAEELETLKSLAIRFIVEALDRHGEFSSLDRKVERAETVLRLAAAQKDA